MPFLHDHIIGDVSPQSRGEDRGNNLTVHEYVNSSQQSGMGSQRRPSLPAAAAKCPQRNPSKTSLNSC